MGYIGLVSIANIEKDALGQEEYARNKQDLTTVDKQKSAKHHDKARLTQYGIEEHL